METTQVPVWMEGWMGGRVVKWMDQWIMNENSSRSRMGGWVARWMEGIAG